MDWIRALKPGDKVYLRSYWGSGWRNATVEKVGRKWITLTGSCRINIGLGRMEDSTLELWQSKEAYDIDYSRRRRWGRVESLADKIANGAKPEFTNGIKASDEALEQIEQLLGLTPKKI